ncbi:MAG: GNAT family N-acetyltransferase [Clostridia bacterium]|nr:GNAT family N-acetyltransferase [Clostridia bacterium]
MEKLLAPGLSFRGMLQGGSSTAALFADPPMMETARLRLRRLRMRDAKDIYAWSSDPEVAKYVLWTAHRSLGDTRGYIRYVKSLYRQGAPCSWGIELKETGKIIGTIGVMGWWPDHRSMEVGYSLGRAWWHQGYAAEALGSLLNLLFEQTEVNRVEGQCDVRNPNSGRVMEKCGMRREGTLRQRVYNKGEYVDVALYAILRTDR